MSGRLFRPGSGTPAAPATTLHGLFTFKFFACTWAVKLDGDVVVDLRLAVGYKREKGFAFFEVEKAM